MNVAAFIEYLNKTKHLHLDADYYGNIEVWRQWWKGDVPDIHDQKEDAPDGSVISRRLASLRRPKHVCEDWANLLLNDKTTLQIGDASTSAYLLDTAKDHIEGKITIDEAQQRIHSYYEQRTTRTEIENETKEADIVSARIAKLLGEKAFQFSPAEWLSIHRRLFEGVFSHAGQIRQYNITKKEWVLNGDTVIYADWNSIKDTLDYDFATEKQFSYEGLSIDAAVKHLAKFASDIWQIHPFGEGNTRATAVFMIKYMKTFGFRVNNDAFEKNSWYFRNALVRANYTNLQKGVHATTKFLEMFFSNLLLGTNHDLKNRYMHVDFVDENISQSAKSEAPKCQIDTLKCTLEELAVLDLIKKNPSVKQTELAEQTGKSVRSIKRITDSLKEKQYLRRVDGKRYGKWEVLA